MMSADRPSDSKLGPVWTAIAAATGAIDEMGAGAAGEAEAAGATGVSSPRASAAMESSGLLVLLEVMSFLETGNKALAPIGIPKSSDSASKEAASKSKNGGSPQQLRRAFR